MTRMTKTQGTVVVVLLLLLLGGLIANVAIALRQSHAPMWQYHIESVDDRSWDTSMIKLGIEGWELVSARRVEGRDKEMKYEMILKRQMRD